MFKILSKLNKLNKLTGLGLVLVSVPFIFKKCNQYNNENIFNTIEITDLIKLKKIDHMFTLNDIWKMLKLDQSYSIKQRLDLLNYFENQKENKYVYVLLKKGNVAVLKIDESTQFNDTNSACVENLTNYCETTIDYTVKQISKKNNENVSNVEPIYGINFRIVAIIDLINKEIYDETNKLNEKVVDNENNEYVVGNYISKRKDIIVSDCNCDRACCCMPYAKRLYSTQIYLNPIGLLLNYYNKIEYIDFSKFCFKFNDKCFYFDKNGYLKSIEANDLKIDYRRLCHRKNCAKNHSVMLEYIQINKPSYNFTASYNENGDIFRMCKQINGEKHGLFVSNYIAEPILYEYGEKVNNNFLRCCAILQFSIINFFNLNIF